jgi:hypothetical protein
MQKDKPPEPVNWDFERTVSEMRRQVQSYAKLDKPPPAPPGWNRTIADLTAELKSGVRLTLGSPEVDWARDYERSLLPPNTRFPCDGDVYEAIEDIELPYMTVWNAPFTGGGCGTIHQGERVVVRYAAPDSHLVLTYAFAVDYHSVEKRIVPERERKAQGYGGFHFAIRTADLNTKFRLVQDRSPETNT